MRTLFAIILLIASVSFADWPIVDGKLQKEDISYSQVAAAAAKGKTTIVYINPMGCRDQVGVMCSEAISILEGLSKTHGKDLAIYVAPANDHPLALKYNNFIKSNRIIVFVNGKEHEIPEIKPPYSEDLAKLGFPAAMVKEYDRREEERFALLKKQRANGSISDAEVARLRALDLENAPYAAQYLRLVFRRHLERITGLPVSEAPPRDAAYSESAEKSPQTPTHR